MCVGIDFDHPVFDSYHPSESYYEEFENSRPFLAWDRWRIGRYDRHYKLAWMRRATFMTLFSPSLRIGRTRENGDCFAHIVTA